MLFKAVLIIIAAICAISLWGLIVIATAWAIFYTCRLIDDHRTIYRRIAQSRASPREPFVRPRNSFPAERASPVHHRVFLHAHGRSEEIAQLSALSAALRAEYEYQHNPV